MTISIPLPPILHPFISILSFKKGSKFIYAKLKATKGNLHACSSASVLSNSVQPHGLYVACQAPLSMEFSRQENWSGLPCLPPGNLSDPGIESVSPASPAMQVDSLLLSHQGSPKNHLGIHRMKVGEGNGNPLQCSCLENPRDRSLVGFRLWDRTESDTTEVT